MVPRVEGRRRKQSCLPLESACTRFRFPRGGGGAVNELDCRTRRSGGITTGQSGEDSVELRLRIGHGTAWERTLPHEISCACASADTSPPARIKRRETRLPSPAATDSRRRVSQTG